MHDFSGTAEEALGQYLDLLAGRQPSKPGEITLADMVNLYLGEAKDRVDIGDLSQLSCRDYVEIGRKIVDHFGRSP